MAELCAGWEDEAGDHHDCQFADESPDHASKGEHYCRFHLPMGGRGYGGKAGWDDNQKAAISDAIVARIREEAEKPEEKRRKLDFSGTVVPGRFALKNKAVGWIDFSGARFHGWADFREARFDGAAFFGEARFDGAVLFEEARFHGWANFGQTRFHDLANFEGARFHDLADFQAARFRGQVDFREARFHGPAIFREARFHEPAYFTAARFRDWADFNGSPDISQAESRRFNDVIFSAARFDTGVDFSNREFLAGTDFNDCVFGRAPNFHGSTLHQNTAFGGIDCFPDVTSDGADRAYRTLRLAMEQHRARAEEGMFFALEQKARRHRMSRRDPAYWLSLFYEKGSDYGLSILRPLLWFAGGIMASTILLLCIGVISDAGGPGADMAAKAADALNFSARQAFLPFDALRMEAGDLEDFVFNPGGAGWLRAWGVALTLFEGLAALLLILAVRWRYRR